MFFALGSLATGCDVGADPYQRGGPAPQVLGVAARPSELGAPDALAADGSSEVFSGSALYVRFDRYMDPRSMIRQSYCLQPDPAVVESFEDCVEGVFTAPAYDPVTRTLALYLDERLVAGNLYTFTVLAPRDGTDVGMRAFDGVALVENFAVSFVVAADSDPPAEIERPAPAPDCSDVSISLGDLHCSDCHSLGKDVTPPAGFTVDVEGLLAAVGRTAHGTSVGAAASESQERPQRFGSNMPLIDDKASAGNSYLLYKLLAHDNDELFGLAEGETERLRAELVVGTPMPPPSEPALVGEDGPREPASLENLQLLSRWIAGGTPCAPTPEP